MMRAETASLRRRLRSLESRDDVRQERLHTAVFDLVTEWATTDPDIRVTMSRYDAVINAQLLPPPYWPEDRTTRNEVARIANAQGFDSDQREALRVELWKIMQAAGTPETDAALQLFERAKREVLVRK